jgi:hypothetical protein
MRQLIGHEWLSVNGTKAVVISRRAVLQVFNAGSRIETQSPDLDRRAGVVEGKAIVAVSWRTLCLGFKEMLSQCTPTA